MLALDNIKQEIKKRTPYRSGRETNLRFSPLSGNRQRFTKSKRYCIREKLYLRTAVFDSFRRLDLLSELLDDQKCHGNHD